MIVFILCSCSYWIGRSTTVMVTSTTAIMSDEVQNHPTILKNTMDLTDCHHQQQPRDNESSFLSRKWTRNTVVVTLSFGINATETNLLERLLYSLQTNGDWHGKIVILTDRQDYYQEKLKAYSSTSPKEDPDHPLSSLDWNKILILPAREHDLYPRNPYNVSRPYFDFVTESMRFKRFKTLILDYLDAYLLPMDLRRNYQHVLYLDVEIVVARPIVGLLQDYQDQMTLPPREVFADDEAQVNHTAVAEFTATSVQDIHTFHNHVDAQRQDTTRTTTTTTTTSTPIIPSSLLYPPSFDTLQVGGFMSFFSDCAKCGRQNFNLNGGVFVLHRIHSRPCLLEWQNYWALGGDQYKYDQRFLVVMKMSLTAAATKKNNKKQEQDSLDAASSLRNQWNQSLSSASASSNSQRDWGMPRLRCKFWQLPDSHRLYPTRKEMRLKKSTTIIHNTNTFGAKKIPLHLQESYFAHLLNTTAFSTNSLPLF